MFKISKVNLKDEIVKKTYPFHYGVARVDYFDGKQNLSVFMKRDGEVAFGPFKEIAAPYFEELEGLISVVVTDLDGKSYTLSLNGEKLSYDETRKITNDHFNIINKDRKELEEKISKVTGEKCVYYEITNSYRTIARNSLNLYALLDDDYNPLTEFKYSQLCEVGDGTFFFTSKENNRKYYGKLDRDGNEILKLENVNKYNFDYGFCEGMIINANRNRSGAFDKDLNNVVKPVHESISSYRYGHCIANDGDVVTFYDANGNETFKHMGKLYENEFHLGMVCDYSIPGLYYSFNGPVLDLKNYFYKVDIDGEIMVLIAKNREEFISKLNAVLSKLTEKHLKTLSNINNLQETINSKEFIKKDL